MFSSSAVFFCFCFCFLFSRSTFYKKKSLSEIPGVSNSLDCDNALSDQIWPVSKLQRFLQTTLVVKYTALSRWLRTARKIGLEDHCLASLGLPNDDKFNPNIRNIRPQTNNILFLTSYTTYAHTTRGFWSKL